MIRDFYTEVLHISDEELLEKLLAKTSIRHIPKGDLLVREGEQVKNIDFLWDGILRGFLLMPTGRKLPIVSAFSAEVRPYPGFERTQFPPSILKRWKTARLSAYRLARPWSW